MNVVALEQIKVLNLFKKSGFISITDTYLKLGISEEELNKLINDLESQGLITIVRGRSNTIKITEEGEKNLEKGFPEEILLKKLDKKTAKISEIDNIAVIWAKKNGWIRISDGIVSLSDNVDAKNYEQRVVLEKIKTLGNSKEIQTFINSNINTIKELEKRKLILIKENKEINSIEITEKGNYEVEEEGISQLTRTMIKEKLWEGKKFKSYSINERSRAYNARLHPVHKFLNKIRNIWVGMGFNEMRGPIIESAFWNFDALFSPQDHPTREMQDTFFLSNPKEIGINDLELLNNVKRMHVKGWQSKWSGELAKQALLRTHSTNVSVRHIMKFGNESVYPIKLFSIGKVFRNESIDYKHLAELFQCDGIIIGESLNLSNLMYTLKIFFHELGLEVKFKPSYFPFVEPGMEIFYYDEKHKDTIELGGSGIIRNEITKAMGTDKKVLAWGIGIDRLMFNSLNLDSLSTLYKNEIGWLRSVKDI